jgi:RimJ/RimL family protein N-acetyltransferase
VEIRLITLTGKRVRLEPLSFEKHFEGLCAIGLDPDLWKWTINVCATRDQLAAYLREALDMQSEGSALPFATVDVESGRVVGCTRFGNIEPRHRRVEIGWTWIGKPYQRSHINTEAKYLMLKHAFETWGCRRVELKTNVLNRKSRDAMERIGAKEEGVLRKHALSDAGVSRDTVYYSIINDEWPGVKERLEAMMAAGPPGPANPPERAASPARRKSDHA